MRTWAAAGIVGEMLLSIALTLWLFPSVWATVRAVVDMDQSAGSDRGVNLTEVANHPTTMFGREVTISAAVEQIVGSHAMVVGNDAFLRGDKLLIVGAADLASLVTPGSDDPLDEEAVVRVTGEVRPFEPVALARALGLRPSDLSIDGYKGTAVLVAREIETDPPIEIGPGDKEFAISSDGYDIGITTYDLTWHPDAFLGEIVTVSGEIEEHLLTPHAFLLGDEALLVVSAKARPELFVEATAYVTGEVRRFDLAELETQLGVDLDDDLLAAYQGKPVIVATYVEMVT